MCYNYRCKEEKQDKRRISQKGELLLKEIVEQFKEQEERTFSEEDTVKLLDSAFLDIEGRPLTKRNKEKVFGNMVFVQIIQTLNQKFAKI